MSHEPPAAPAHAIGGDAWRSDAEARQQEALPGGRVLVTSSAPFGGGGLGRHLKEIVDALRRNGQEADYLCEGEGADQHELRVRRSIALMPLTRFSSGWRLWSASVGFDRAAAAALRPADHLIGFNGTSLRQMRAASCPASIVSATAHMRHVVEQHTRAHRQYPLERPWAARLLARNLAEYERAERIYVSSRYVRQSFVDRGVREDLLVEFPLTPDPRYRPAAPGGVRETFDVVYVGGLSVDKGVPLLLEAIARVQAPDLRLLLVGGWKSRGMRRHVMAACARDPRVQLAPGDPLERLRGASLYVHPTYSDGFAYAPAEALACGVPVFVSEDTGMKELVLAGENGLVLPTGDVTALAEAIGAAHRRELLS
ncbi:MAG TPA: glycosyltransferase family 4 protein [Solirubrobacteraceae bacterium]|jgi:glycosyltransferase involved in cell wall biosynthesis|nr:glycosyltransferase family 4 protein [Solirubrobacteraceae bacterium]